MLLNLENFLQDGIESDLDHWISSLFATKHKNAKDYMIPINDVDIVSSDATAREIKEKMKKEYKPYFPVYKKRSKQIAGVLSPRDLLKLSDDAHIGQCLKTPWFISTESSIFEIIRDFRWNNQEIGVVVNESGKPIGMVTLDRTIAEVLPETKMEQIALTNSLDKAHIMIDRTFSSSAKVVDICEQYQIDLTGSSKEQSLENLMEEKLKHPPGMGEVIVIGEFEIKVVNAPLIGDKTISIRSL